MTIKPSPGNAHECHINGHLRPGWHKPLQSVGPVCEIVRGNLWVLQWVQDLTIMGPKGSREDNLSGAEFEAPASFPVMGRGGTSPSPVEDPGQLFADPCRGQDTLSAR